MSHDGSTASIASTARGFGIFCAVVGFTAGYPLLVFAALEPHPFLLAKFAAFATTAFFMGLGFGWARVVHILLCLGVVMFSLMGLYSALRLGIRNEMWPIIVPLFVVPLVGYTAAVGLLCTHGLKNWQASIRERRNQQVIAATSSNLFAIETAATNAALKRCPWCDAVAVNPSRSQCLACNRPV